MRSDVAQLSTLFQLTTVRWRDVQRGANYEVTFTESAGQYQPGLKSSALSSLMHGAASKCSIFIILNTSVVLLRERLNTNEVIVLTLLRCYVVTLLRSARLRLMLFMYPKCGGTFDQARDAVFGLHDHGRRLLHRDYITVLLRRRVA